MERKDHTYRISLIVLIVTYFVGIAGFHWEALRPAFLWMTPFHLLMTSFLLIINQKNKGGRFWIFVFASSVLGYLVEVAGVKTGLIFGHYQYGSTLGLKLFDVPLMIGVNWFLLTFSVGITLKSWIKNDVLAIFIATLALVVIDYFIEPVAVRLDFWGWQAGIIPLQNFVGWFFTALVIMTIFKLCKIELPNPLAKFIVLSQLVFFIVLGIIL